MQKSIEQLQPERGILAEAWYILRDHVGIESRDYNKPEVAEEWRGLVGRCERLYNTAGTEAQESLAKAVSLAIMDYYDKLSTQ